MTYEFDDQKASFATRFMAGIVSFFNSLFIRLVVVFAISAVAVPFIADNIYPSCMTGVYNEIVSSIADQIKDKPISATKILQTINQYNLAWYYVTDGDGKVTKETKVFSPDIPCKVISHPVDWKEKKYYEAVANLTHGNILHIGFYTGPMFQQMFLGKFGTAVSAPAGYLLLCYLILFAFVAAVLNFAVAQPLGHLARACSSLLLARDAYSSVTGGGLDVAGAVAEVQLMSAKLRGIRRQYDEQVAARISKESELTRQRHEHEAQKKSISKSYEDQLLQTKEKISELNTKEAEEEFINALGREIDALKSSQQVCQRILDKLNDKFPTSIIHGVFYKSEKHLRFGLEAHIGFDDKSLQVLKKYDPTNIAREVFSSGKYILQSAEVLAAEISLAPIIKSNGIQNAIYLPLTFQNRSLGVMGIYFNTEGQTVQDRLRVLRNVVELASRSLYQVIIYEEELEAARTDPLTGLRNKKFFYEIMPQIFDRASVNPTNNPISLLMMDGDHFKEINDTYGHQLGDQMLQDLAKTLRQCVRVQDGMPRSGAKGDYLIRYGGEEFLIVMENTDAKGATAVAERVRQAVESKSDWPGGIARWTISIGVSTYPADGMNVDELLLRADTALYYVKEKMGRNQICHSAKVPKGFKSANRNAAIGGELGVFDPADLLQSLSAAHKTGILTVQSREGKQLWMLFEGGRPVQARLGKFGGANAIIEFMTVFEDGNFNFQEKGIANTMTKLPKLEEGYNVQKPIEMCVIEGSVAQDHYNAAKVIIPSDEVIIKPIPKEEFAVRWHALGTQAEPPSKQEYDAMTEIIHKADGRTTLAAIFKQLDTTPSHILWRAASILIQHGMIEQTPVMVS